MFFSHEVHSIESSAPCFFVFRQSINLNLFLHRNAHTDTIFRKLKVLKFQHSLWSLRGLFTFPSKSQFYLKASTSFNDKYIKFSYTMLDLLSIFNCLFVEISDKFLYHFGAENSWAFSLQDQFSATLLRLTPANFTPPWESSNRRVNSLNS